MSDHRPLQEISSHIRHQLASQADYSTQELDNVVFWLLEHYLSITRTQWLLNKPVTLLPEVEAALQKAIERFSKGEPIQYVLGECDFYGRKLTVTPDVLIPRRETEELVRMVIEQETGPVRILDIGTGSGCIAITLAKEINKADVWAIDNSNLALRVATQNAQVHAAAVTFREIDILEDIHFAEKFDVVVSNPPYVRRSESKHMDDRVILHEPNGALFVEDKQPLVFYERMAMLGKAGKLLQNGGQIYWEINEALGEELKQMLIKFSFSNISVRQDMQGKDRFVTATLEV